ncbi:OmpP1/FadL family transporter [Pseudooctadecabacter jejudonensis]|uniref:Outer membrane protein transport protein (OMPP1/FadL/TodX) n=1 Tax=Pseudooctadecabacter jejudonensis TaxID=1391910 RepID=A0A1Y5RGB9_9RHOB|nr:hypothetical protein [Pseudooctadecabacter jejudonensis]SLN15585.1 Outer membrane protein transport protein (OMPP1/FadL/TodX) [Pseudooctadecabacter jejudonensis]
MKTYMTAGAALLLTTTAAVAGGIDRSGQFLGPLFEEGGETGSYFQFSFGYVSPEANANDIPGPASAFVPSDPLSSYSSLSFAYKTDLSDQLSAALIIDEPFGVNVEYTDGAFGGSPLTDLDNGRANIGSTAVTGVLRYKLNNGFSVHGGVRAQEIGGEILAGAGFLRAESDFDFGYLVGAAYERPDIALRIAVTYNSEIDNDLTGIENNTPADPTATVGTAFTVTSPESINLEFQTGIAADTLLFGSIRHAMYDGYNLTTDNAEFVSFADDTTAYSVGVGRRLSDSLSVFATIGFEDAGVRPSTTALAPTTGTRSVGIGATYTMGQLELTGGISYVELGDQVVNASETLAFDFEDNSAIGAGFRIGYNF